MPVVAVAVLAAVVVVALVGVQVVLPWLSGDDEEPAASAPIDPLAKGVAEFLIGPTTVEYSETDSEELADYFRNTVPGVSESEVTSDGKVVVTVQGVTRDEADILADDLRTPDLVSLAPVLALGACTEEALEAGGTELPARDGTGLCVGPLEVADGRIFARRSASVDNEFGYAVFVELRDGDGQQIWNDLATQCFNGTPTCPRTSPGSNGQLSIILDGEVQSAPSVNQPVFDGAVSITGNFTEDEARYLATTLNLAPVLASANLEQFVFASE